MANLEKIIEVGVSVGSALTGNDNITKFFCGSYSDGTPRSLPDAINGEFLSPKQKKKATKKKKKKSVKFKL